MQTFIDFLVNNYLWFLIISLILIFALIGYFVDTNEKKDVVNNEALPNENVQSNPMAINETLDSNSFGENNINKNS